MCLCEARRHIAVTITYSDTFSLLFGPVTKYLARNSRGWDLLDSLLFERRKPESDSSECSDWERRGFHVWHWNILRQQEA